MSQAFKLSVVAPDRTVFEDDVESVIVPGLNGYLGVLAHHESMLLALRPGLIEYQDTNRQRSFVTVSGGFADISENSVIILAQDALQAHEIDVAGAEKALDEARKALRGESSSMTSQQATEEIERALARINAARRR